MSRILCPPFCCDTDAYNFVLLYSHWSPYHKWGPHYSHISNHFAKPNSLYQMGRILLIYPALYLAVDRAKLVLGRKWFCTPLHFNPSMNTWWQLKWRGRWKDGVERVRDEAWRRKLTYRRGRLPGFPNVDLGSFLFFFYFFVDN